MNKQPIFTATESTEVKTSILSGISLDYAVAIALGLEVASVTAGHIIINTKDDNGSPLSQQFFKPTKNWTQTGILIEQGIDLVRDTVDGEIVYAGVYDDTDRIVVFSDTPQEAICRCYVTTKLGENVIIPNELLDDLMRILFDKIMNEE